MEMPITCNPCGPYCRCHWTKVGISTWQEAHQVAQKSSSTTLPRKLARSILAPSKPVRENSGAFLLRRDVVCAPATAKQAVSSKAASCRRLIADLTLVSALNRIPLVYPIASQVVGHVKNLHVGES